MHNLFCLLRSLRSRAATLAPSLGRWLTIGLLAVALWGGAIGLAPAQAANLTDTEVNDAGPIRQSYNPISKENFSGGVDRTALESKDSVRPPQPERNSGLFAPLKRLFSGSAAKDSAPSPQSNVQPERNPTLDRYQPD